jgi:hypothetical protein
MHRAGEAGACDQHGTSRVTQKVFESKPESRRYVGRPRLRGLEDVDSDL